MSHVGRFSGNSTAYFAALGLVFAFLVPGTAQADCARTITAKVVALDQPIMYNRLGAQNINGMVFALRRDVVVRTGVGAFAAGTPITQTNGLTGAQLAGNVQLRPDKRPRPLVLRVAGGRARLGHPHGVACRV